ncbi:MAG: serine hydrolase [Saprospiraceae bacterium]
MLKKRRTLLLLTVFLLPIMGFYPIDGYERTGIKRLKRLELIDDGEMKGKELDPGATLLLKDIKLHLPRVHRDSVAALFEVDEEMQKELNSFFPNLDESYSLTVMDITSGKPTRYARRQEDRQFQPGSVGKLAVVVGFFAELSKIYPYSFEKRVELMKNRSVRAGQWGVKDQHTVPFYDIEKERLVKRQVTTSDVFTLYEWIDHMLSVSNNGAAAIVWREAILMRVFGKKYPTLTDEEANEYFEKTKKSELTEIHLQVVNDPLRKLGIGEDEWRLGTLFTRGASGIIPPKGGSVGSPLGLMKFMVALERGVVVDYLSSLEIKRLMYLTDRRIRYASNKALDDAAVYFKSGSLYSCDRTTMPDCGKYRGNRMNYMNSVSIIERPDGTAYLVALMTNVLKRNSNSDHNRLAGKIDELVRGL